MLTYLVRCFVAARHHAAAFTVASVLTLCGAVSARAAVAFDAAVSKSATNASSVTWSHTVGSGSNMILVVALATEDTSSSVLTVSSITYNGVAMTAVPNASVSSGSSTLDKAQLFYLLNPTAGAHTISITFGGAVNGVSAGSISLSGVNQAAPATAATNSATSGSSLSESATVATAGSWIVDAFCSGASNANCTPGSSQTSRWSISESSNGGAGSTQAVTSTGTATSTWTASSSSQLALALAVLAPAGGTGATAPSITTQPSNETVAAGSAASFSVTASGTAPLSYQWTFNGANLSGATSATYSIASAQTVNQGSYAVVVSNSAGSATSNAATLTVTSAATAPAITTQPSNQTVATGSSASFSVVASGTAPLSYQWTFNGAALSGATAATYTISSAQAANQGTYAVTVSNSAGSATSNGATLTVTSSATAPTITTQPSSQTTTVGSSVTFSVVASGTAPLTYQWTFNGSSLTGATSSSYTIASVQSSNAGSYAVKVSNSAGSVTSTTATLTISTPTGSAPLITTQPTSQSVANGASVNFSVTASGSGLSYQWYRNGTALSGATAATYSFSNAQPANVGAYSVTVSNSSGADASRIATLVTQPVIPSATYLITSYGAKGDGTTDNTTAVQNAINAASTAGGGTVEVPAATAAFECGPITVASNINLQIDSGAVLQALPKASYPSASTNFITFSGVHDVAITGAGTIDGNGAGWWSTSTRPKLIHMSETTTVLVKNTGSGSNVLTLLNSPKEHFICDEGVNNVTVDGLVISAPATSPNTDGIDPAGTDWLIQNCNISDGDDDVAVKAQVASAGDILINNCTIGTGHGLSIGAQTDFGVTNFRVTNCTFSGTDYVVRLKSERGEGGLVSNVLYDHVTYSGINKAVIYISSYYDSLPSNPASDSGSTFDATTTPQWQNIVISNLSGSTVSSPSKGIGDIWGVPESPIANVVLDNVVVTGSSKTLTVNHARNVSYVNGTALPLASGADDLYDVNPLITVQPQSQTVTAGSNVTLTVSASSAGSQTYQWSKNGAAISGATGASLVLSGVTSASAGSYSVAVTNSTGTAQSDDALLTVN